MVGRGEGDGIQKSTRGKQIETRIFRIFFLEVTNSQKIKAKPKPQGVTDTSVSEPEKPSDTFWQCSTGHHDWFRFPGTDINKCQCISFLSLFSIVSIPRGSFDTIFKAFTFTHDMDSTPRSHFPPRSFELDCWSWIVHHHHFLENCLVPTNCTELYLLSNQAAQKSRLTLL